MSESIEVFQDLHIRSTDSLAALRAALLSNIGGAWEHVPEREADMKDAIASDEESDVIAFERSPADGLPSLGLLLWSFPGGYEVSNIVPLDVGEIGADRYNAALQDFVKQVVQPATQDAIIKIDLGKAAESIADWISPEAAALLRLFSAAANKSTGSAHPMDRRRWFEFLIATHRAGKHPSAEMLSRWLVQVDGWPERVASRLAVEFEFGLALLRAAERAEGK